MEGLLSPTHLFFVAVIVALIVYGRKASSQGNSANSIPANDKRLESTTPQGSKYCIHCGKEIPSEMNFCGYCGKEQSPTLKPNPIDRIAATAFVGSKGPTSWGWLPKVVVAIVGGYIAITILVILFNFIADVLGQQQFISEGYINPLFYVIFIGIPVLWREIRGKKK